MEPRSRAVVRGLCLCLIALTLPLHAQLAANIETIVNTPPLDHAVWGIDVEDDAGNVLYAKNAHNVMLPASNRKMFSVASDVNCLGLDARFTTELWLDGDDVVIRGDGDPSFGSDRHESPGFAPFIAALRARRVTHVRDVIADVSRFDREILPGSWKLGNILSDYSAPVDALACDENVANDLAVPSPALFTATSLRDALTAAGIRVDGVPRVVREPHAWREYVASVQSPMLFQLLYTVLKNSHNLYAEMLFKRSGIGSYEDAEERERVFLTSEIGIDPNDFHFVDGSGLSPEDLVAPAASVRLLRWYFAPERRGVWWMIFAEPGGEGTLRRRLLELAPRLRAKTGTINEVATISGVVAGEHGGMRYFSVMLNHHLAGGSEAQHALDAVVREIAKF